MKTLEFSQKPFDQTPRFSISEFSVWGTMQKRKLGDGKTWSLIECVKAELILIKRTLTKVSYYLERLLVVIQFIVQPSPKSKVVLL